MRYITLIALFFVVVNCDDIIEVEDISKKEIVIHAPSDGSVLTDTIVNFSWQIVEESEKYKLQIATPDFETSTQIVLDTTIPVTNYTKKLALGIYEWRVRAENSGFQTNYKTQRFSIEE